VKALPPVAVDGLIAVLLAVFILPNTLVTLMAVDITDGWLITLLAAVAVLHITPALRRTAPTVGYALACGSMSAIVSAPNGELLGSSPGMQKFPFLLLPSSLVFLPALNAVAVRATRRLSILALLAGLLGVVLGTLRLVSLTPAGYPRLQYQSYVVLALLITILSSWGLGTAKRARDRFEAAERAEAARSAILAERTRIAQDMHDVVAHSLAVVVRLAEAGALITSQSPDRARGMLLTIADTGREALCDMRGMLGVLRDPDAATPVTPSQGIDEVRDGVRRDDVAPRPTLADLPAVIDRVRTTGVEVTMTESGTALPLGGAAELAAFHVVQEALTNMVKHARARARAEVTLTWLPDRLVVLIEDDGGAPLRENVGNSPVPGSGTGLIGLRERLAAVGGTIRTQQLDEGFRVRVELPTRSAGPADKGHEVTRTMET
jgi:signal transduction histidine kinase